jgi:outer membrane protein OmpA-like peptidoglycan-associated protein
MIERRAGETWKDYILRRQLAEKSKLEEHKAKALNNLLQFATPGHVQSMIKKYSFHQDDDVILGSKCCGKTTLNENDIDSPGNNLTPDSEDNQNFIEHCQTSSHQRESTRDIYSIPTSITDGDYNSDDMKQFLMKSNECNHSEEEPLSGLRLNKKLDENQYANKSFHVTKLNSRQILFSNNSVQTKSLRIKSDILFESGHSKLLDIGKLALDKLLQALHHDADKHLILRIEGHINAVTKRGILLQSNSKHLIIHEGCSGDELSLKRLF